MKGKDEARIWDALNIHFNEESMQPSMTARLKKVEIFFKVITSAVQMYGKHERARIDPEYLQKMINHDAKVNRAAISIIFNELVSMGWSVDVASKGIVNLLDIETQKRKAPLFARQRKETEKRIAEAEKREKLEKEKERLRKIKYQKIDEHNAEMKIRMEEYWKTHSNEPKYQY